MFFLSRLATNPLQQLWRRAAQLNIEHGRLLSALAAKLGDPCACDQTALAPLPAMGSAAALPVDLADIRWTWAPCI